MKNKLREHETLRTIAQALSFAFHNGYISGWTHGKISNGTNKGFCVPGLNCYSCPGAVGACPIGSLQAGLNGFEFKAVLYVLGFIGIIGILCGRLVCGWICPFGLVQDLLYKIPVFKKKKSIKGHKYLKYLKYVILVIFVILLPMIVLNKGGVGEPWFCEWICPDGTLLGGIPLVISNESLRTAIGGRFIFKMTLLIVILLGSVKLARPFCKYICPLGALYSLCNPVSKYRFNVDNDKCVHCGACKNVCPMDIDVIHNPNSMECIRCGKCMNVCSNAAISSSWEDFLKKSDKKESNCSFSVDKRGIRNTIMRIVSVIFFLASIGVIFKNILFLLNGILGGFPDIAAALRVLILWFVTGIIVGIVPLIMWFDIVKNGFIPENSNDYYNFSVISLKLLIAKLILDFVGNAFSIYCLYRENVNVFNILRSLFIVNFPDIAVIVIGSFLVTLWRRRKALK